MSDFSPFIAWLRSIQLTDYFGKGRTLTYQYTLSEEEDVISVDMLPVSALLLIFAVFSVLFWVILVFIYWLVGRKYP